MPTYHPTVIQGSDEWHAARCGLLTASEMRLILTPTLKVASNEKERAHLYELLAQRVTRYVEPHYVSDDMLRGHEDEAIAAGLYADKSPEPVTECGFVTNDRWGFTLGYSPDRLVGAKGLLECKSRRQKFQIETILHHRATGEIPADYLLQCHTGLTTADDREWLDLVSFCGGLPMYVMRVHPDPIIADAIINAAGEFERRLQEKLSVYLSALHDHPELFTPTERRIEQEMFT